MQNYSFFILSRFPKESKNPKTRNLNPSNTLEGVFDRLGGILCIYKGHGTFNYKGEPVIAFVWFHSNFINLVDLSETIELNASFKVLAPEVFCIPQMIF